MFHDINYLPRKRKKIPPMKNQNTNWIRSFTNCYLSGGINFCTISPLSLLWFLHVLRLGRAAVSGQSDFLPPTVLSHHSVIVNKIWCFCCYSYSCSLWLGGHYKERDTYTSKKGSSKFQTRISFILGQFHSILFNLCCFIWVFSSLCFAEPAK